MKHPRFFILHLSETSWFQYKSSGDFVVSQGRYKINSRGLLECIDLFVIRILTYSHILESCRQWKKNLYILWIMIFEQQQKMNCGTRLSRISLFLSGEILTINDILRWPGSITVLSIDKGVRVSWLVSFHISLGMIVNGSFCDTPTQEQMYDDGDYWEVRWTNECCKWDRRGTSEGGSTQTLFENPCARAAGAVLESSLRM